LDGSQLVVDSGNLLFKPSGSQQKSKKDTLTATTIMRSYLEMGYDAVAISSHDLKAGMSFFSQSQGMGFPWVSVNVFDTSGKHLFKPHIIKTIGKIRIGIIGLTANIQHSDKNIIINDWQESLQSEIDKISNTTDLIILLSELALSQNKVISQKHPEIDIIISAEKSRGNLSPQIVGNALITQTHDRGRYLGKLSLSYHHEGEWRVNNRQQMQKSLKNRINSVEWQLKQLHKRQSQSQQEKYTKKIAELEKFKNGLEQKLTNEISDATKTNKKPATINTFKTDFIAIKPNLPKSKEVELLIKNLKKEIKSHNQQLLKSKNRQKNTNSGIMDFVGYADCKQCHIEQTTFWKTTQHSKAFATLASKGEEQNTECLPCHVTTAINSSSSEQEKISLLSLSKNLNTIGCESCHGSAKAHIAAPEDNLPTRTPKPALCKKCHTPERDTSFSYKTKIRLISCPTG